MKKCMTQMLQGFVLGAGSFSLVLAVQPAAAQSAATPPYLDTSLTPEQRAADYAVHSGPEPTRHFADVDVSKHDEVDIRAGFSTGRLLSIFA